MKMLGNDWAIVPFGELVENKDSKRVPLKESDRTERHGIYPYYGASGIIDHVDGYLYEGTHLLIGEDGANLLARSTPIAFLADGKFWVNNHAHVLAATERAELKYLQYFFETLDLKPYVTGSAQPKLTRKSLDRIPVPLPPIAEQRRIAAILDRADAVRRKRQEAIALTEELLRSAFLEMFGDPITNPKGWEMKTLGSLCTIVRGGSPRPINEYLGGTVPWIKIGDGTDGDDIYISKTAEAIKPEGVKKSRYLEPGSLIFANCGVSLGFARILRIGGCIHDGWLAFSDINPSLNKIYLLKLLNSITNHFRAIAPDGTQPNLNTSIMKEFCIPIPPLDLQEQFAELTEKLISSKERFTGVNKESDNFFNSLLQRAFRGEL